MNIDPQLAQGFVDEDPTDAHKEHSKIFPVWFMCCLFSLPTLFMGKNAYFARLAILPILFALLAWYITLGFRYTEKLRNSYLFLGVTFIVNIICCVLDIYNILSITTIVSPLYLLYALLITFVSYIGIRFCMIQLIKCGWHNKSVKVSSAYIAVTSASSYILVTFFARNFGKYASKHMQLCIIMTLILLWAILCLVGVSRFFLKYELSR